MFGGEEGSGLHSKQRKKKKIELNSVDPEVQGCPLDPVFWILSRTRPSAFNPHCVCPCWGVAGWPGACPVCP